MNRCHLKANHKSKDCAMLLLAGKAGSSDKEMLLTVENGEDEQRQASNRFGE
jgi:hypothetical protein